jgi:hypothetical protein
MSKDELLGLLASLPDGIGDILRTGGRSAVMSHADAAGSASAVRPQRVDPDRLVQEGDLLGLLAYYERQDVISGAFDPGQRLRDCIRALHKSPQGLAQTALDAVLEFALRLFTRTRLEIEHVLTRDERSAWRKPLEIPQVLLDGGWFERAERQARFLMEVVTLQARVRHVGALADGTNSRRKRSEPRREMDEAGAAPGTEA